jgi:hypothetical protein
MIDGPQAPSLPPAALEATAAAAEQDARYAIRVESLNELGLIRFVKVNKHVAELEPPTLYLSYDVLLKIAGNILVSIDCGRMGVG